MNYATIYRFYDCNLNGVSWGSSGSLIGNSIFNANQRRMNHFHVKFQMVSTGLFQIWFDFWMICHIFVWNIWFRFTLVWLRRKLVTFPYTFTCLGHDKRFYCGLIGTPVALFRYRDTDISRDPFDLLQTMFLEKSTFVPSVSPKAFSIESSLNKFVWDYIHAFMNIHCSMVSK